MGATNTGRAIPRPLTQRKRHKGSRAALVRTDAPPVQRLNRESRIMKLITRLLAILFVVPAAFYFVSLVFLPFLWPAESSEQLSMIVIARIVFSLSCAVAAGWFVWSKLGSAHQGKLGSAHQEKPGSARQGLISSILTGAILFGGIGFSAGYFGPIIFTLGEQGPMIGFITGPLGFVLGGVAGSIYFSLRNRKAQP